MDFCSFAFSLWTNFWILIFQMQGSELEAWHCFPPLKHTEKSNSAFHSPATSRAISKTVCKTSSPEPADKSSGVPLEVERYFDVAAEVCDFVSRFDSEPLHSDCP